MTDHKKLKMYKEKVSVRDEELIREILKRCRVAVVGIHDEPYPYCVPMNYGFEWEDQLIFYFHMATDGHRIRLLKRDNRVSMAIYEFLDRHGYKRVHNEPHDYRSVMAYGRAEIICPEQEEEYLHGMNVLLAGQRWPLITRITPDMKNRMLILKITADIVTGKAQYPVSSLDEVPIPPNIPLD